VTEEIVARLADVMNAVRAVPKDGVNSAQHFSFRGIDDVLNAVGPALRDVRVVVLPQVEFVDISSVEVGSKRTPMAHVNLRVRYRFIAEDGSFVDAVVPAEAFDSGDKAVSKAMSVAYRTCLIQALCLPTNEPDPDASSYERTPTAEQEDRFDVLRLATKALADPSPVVDWVKAEGVTRGSLTDEVAEEWQARIELAASLEVAAEKIGAS
jgi:hypothetical protein